MEIKVEITVLTINFLLNNYLQQLFLGYRIALFSARKLCFHALILQKANAQRHASAAKGIGRKLLAKDYIVGADNFKGWIIPAYPLQAMLGVSSWVSWFWSRADTVRELGAVYRVS